MKNESRLRPRQQQGTKNKEQGTKKNARPPHPRHPQLQHEPDQRQGYKARDAGTQISAGPRRTFFVLVALVDTFEILLE
jgi:hypothetical protein